MAFVLDRRSHIKLRLDLVEGTTLRREALATLIKESAESKTGGAFRMMLVLLMLVLLQQQQLGRCTLPNPHIRAIRLGVSGSDECRDLN